MPQKRIHAPCLRCEQRPHVLGSFLCGGCKKKVAEQNKYAAARVARGRKVRAKKR